MLLKKMSDQDFEDRTHTLYQKVMGAFDGVDPDLAEVFFHLDNITITFADKTKFIINRQPPSQQIWLATKTQGLHFDFDPQQGKWIHSKTGDEFFSTLKKNVEQYTKQQVNF